jgi:hypothetical protein
MVNIILTNRNPSLACRTTQTPLFDTLSVGGGAAHYSSLNTAELGTSQTATKLEKYHRGGNAGS